MRTLSLLALLLVGCGPQVGWDFESRCGARFMGQWPYGLSADLWNEDSFQKLEDRTISVFSAEVGDPRFTRLGICKALKGTRFWIHPQTKFTREEVGYFGEPGPDGKPISIAGMTSCLNRTIIIGSHPLKTSAFPHEVAHLVQECSPLLPLDSIDPDHSNWIRERIFMAIDKVLELL